MARQVTTNKLAVYLIKEEYLEHKDILKNIGSLQSISLSASGILYCGNSFNFPPSWLNKFFGSALGNSATKLFNASSQFRLVMAGLCFPREFGKKDSA